MNWTRGLIRLWILASLLFAFFVGCGAWSPTVGIWHFIISVAILSISVSLLVFLIGAATVWVIRGLQPN